MVETTSSGMTIKQDLIVFAMTASLFAAGCIAMLTADDALSPYPIVTYGFIAMWGVSALGWPLFLIRAVRKTIRIAFRKQRS
ncbi:hypothetical protein [Sphingomonas oleivorans]|nr:hypothetical protein [Sphingomonas oleivorans]